MLRRSVRWSSPLLALGLALSVLGADAFQPRPHDWPQWLGRDRTGVSPETGLLKTWPKAGPPLAWQIKNLGDGYATPTVAAGRIFSMGNRDKTEYVMAFAEDGGKELWATATGSVRADGGGYEGPRCSPTVDGDRVYALGLNGDLVCVQAASGKEVWRKDLVKDFDGRGGHWGYSESPLIDGDKLLCTPGGKKATLVALNKKTGELIWKGVVPQGDHAEYSSILPVQADGKRQYVQFLSGGVVGLSEDGTFLWRYDAPHNGTANCSTPLFRDGHVFAASGYGTGGGLVKLTNKGDKWTADEVYFTKHMKNHHGGMVLIDGYIYGSDEGLLTCLDFKTGEVKWAARAPGKGSIGAADGRLYYRNEDEGGPVVLVEVNPEKYVEVGRLTPPAKSGDPSWPHPVVANGKLYLRDQGYLFCYDVKAR
jgi:outer membrane protein assembly factor BamB